MKLLSSTLSSVRGAHARTALGLLVAQAKLRRSTVELDVGPGLELGRRVRFTVAPGTHNRLKIGAGCSIGDDVLVHLKGADLEWGDGVEVRRGTVLNVSGRLHLVGRNIISYGNVIHCATSITLDECASTNEYVSIIDSTHHHDGESDFFYENTTAAPISIGANAWICNKASVLMGVTIGANAVVASHAVVNRDVPSATVVGGLPAKVLAERSVGGAALRFSSPQVADHAAPVA